MTSMAFQVGRAKKGELVSEGVGRASDSTNSSTRRSSESMVEDALGYVAFARIDASRRSVTNRLSSLLVAEISVLWSVVLPL